jgi:hypothetical protein
MSDPEKADLQEKLNELSNRLHTRIKEFREKGEFADVHKALLSQIQQRNAELTKRVSEAERKGATWELLKAEFTRDYRSLFHDLLELEERLESEAMKNKGQ